MIFLYDKNTIRYIIHDRYGNNIEYDITCTVNTAYYSILIIQWKCSYSTQMSSSESVLNFPEINKN